MSKLILAFVPGLEGGDGEYITETIPAELESRGVPFKCYSIKGRDSIQDHARRLQALMEQDLQADPDTRFHLLGHSMGGLIARFALNHLTLLGKPFKDFVITAASVSTPHRGTPAGMETLNLGKISIPIRLVYPAVAQMSENGIREFNDPSGGAYSPEVEGVPFYSYRSYMQSIMECTDLMEFYGFSKMTEGLKKLGRDTRNDAVVPFDSQLFGTLVQDVRAHHDYFTNESKKRPEPFDFYEQHWNFVKDMEKPGEVEPEVPEVPETPEDPELPEDGVVFGTATEDIPAGSDVVFDLKTHEVSLHSPELGFGDLPLKPEFKAYPEGVTDEEIERMDEEIRAFNYVGEDG